MDLFKSKERKEFEKKMQIKKARNDMVKQIDSLEKMKYDYKDKAVKAKQLGSDSQLKLALSGYKMAAMQQRRIQEMLLNFDLTSQMKDMSQTTSDFLKSMSLFSRDIAKITNNSDFLKVQQEFEFAMSSVEESSEKLDDMLNTSQSTFDTFSTRSAGETSKELMGIIDSEAANKETSMDADIDRELAKIEKSIMKIDN